MEMKPYRAFGLIFMISRHFVGERYRNKVIDPDCTIFCIKGKEVITDFHTQDHVLDFAEGQLYSPGNYIPGDLVCDVVEELDFFCYDPSLNMNHDQKFEKVVMDGGSQTIIKKDTRFLLCRGSIEIDGTRYDAPARLKIESGDKLATTLTPVMGLNLL